VNAQFWATSVMTVAVIIRMYYARLDYKLRRQEYEERRNKRLEGIH
jgi:hypothetical protein